MYLHANSVEKLADLVPLSQLKGLRKLTLHGNAVESTPHYRSFVLLLVRPPRRDPRLLECRVVYVLQFANCHILCVCVRTVPDPAHARFFGGDGRRQSGRAISEESL